MKVWGIYSESTKKYVRIDIAEDTEDGDMDSSVFLQYYNKDKYCTYRLKKDETQELLKRAVDVVQLTIKNLEAEIDLLRRLQNMKFKNVPQADLDHIRERHYIYAGNQKDFIMELNQCIDGDIQQCDEHKKEIEQIQGMTVVKIDVPIIHSKRHKKEFFETEYEICTHCGYSMPGFIQNHSIGPVTLCPACIDQLSKMSKDSLKKNKHYFKILEKHSFAQSL